MAASNLDIELLKAAEDGDTVKLKSLIAQGADVSFQEEDNGTSPLMASARGGHGDSVNCLLEAGAPWNAVDRNGNCAGDFALQGEHSEIVESLINAGIRSELILGAASRNLTGGLNSSEASNLKYLEQRVEYSESSLLDEDKAGVMMAWEKPLMESHAQVICQQGGDILNVGFGMGLIDTAIQNLNPKSHTIVEAHRGVLARMKEQGWYEKPGVKIIEGRWQDVLSKLGTYDGIFFDTYGEYYDDLRDFHEELRGILKPNGVYSFFNGMCGDNAFFHVVYCQIVALELARLGLTTQFIQLPVGNFLEGVSQTYWQLDTYFLPYCSFGSEEEDDTKDLPSNNNP